MSGADQVQRLVTFVLGESWYAADIAHVERVLRHEAVYAVPGMPSWVEGVIDYRGRVVPVVDLHRRFGLPEGERANGGRLLVFTLGDDVIAASVDRVVDVRSVAAGELAPPPRLVRGAGSEFVRAMMRDGEAMVLVLDLLRLLSDDEQAALEGCLDAPGIAAAAGRASHA